MANPEGNVLFQWGTRSTCGSSTVELPGGVSAPILESAFFTFVVEGMQRWTSLDDKDNHCVNRDKESHLLWTAGRIPQFGYLRIRTGD